MMPFKDLTKAQNKEEIRDETRRILRTSININISDVILKRLVSTRSDSIRRAIENKVPRIIIQGLGSIKIKKNKEATYKRLGKITDERGIFKYEYKIVSNESENL